MTLVNPEPLGYALNQLLPSADVNSVWSQLTLALDGNAGGAYSPSAAIVLAAKGLQVTGLFDAPGNGLYNVKRYNAVGDTATDDTAAIQAAEDAVTAVTAGGNLLFPPGTYRITADLVKKHQVNWIAIPGTVTITMDHATENFLTFTGAAWTREALIYGINFEGTQSNAGTFCIETGTLHLLRFQECKINKSATLLAGRLFSAVSASQLVFEDCDIRTVKVNDNHWAHTRVEFIRGKVTLAPAATSDMISVAGELVVDGTEFVQVSTVGNVAFIDTNGGSVRVDNARLNVDDSGAGATTYLIKVNGGQIHTSNLDFYNNGALYEFAAIAGAGSRLQLDPAARITGAGDLTILNGIAAVMLESGKATAPTITMPAIFFMGQTLDVALYNSNAGTWAGNPTFAGALFEGTGASGLLTLDTLSVRFVALDYVGGGAAWVQVGGHQKID